MLWAPPPQRWWAGEVWSLAYDRTGFWYQLSSMFLTELQRRKLVPATSTALEPKPPLCWALASQDIINNATSGKNAFIQFHEFNSVAPWLHLGFLHHSIPEENLGSEMCTPSSSNMEKRTHWRGKSKCLSPAFPWTWATEGIQEEPGRKTTLSGWSRSLWLAAHT